MIKRIWKIIFGVHFAIIWMLCLHHLFWKEKPKTKMVIRTIPQKVFAVEKPATKKITPKQAAVVKPKAVATTKAKPIEKPVAKTTIEPPIVKAKPVESKTSALVVPVLKEISLPQELPEKIEEEKPSYGQTLIAYLQGCLDLPEFGEVKVDLEIDRNGHLVRFEIIEEKSKKNSDFLKKQLPELAYPCFNDFSHETAVFTITFKNSTGIVR